MIEAKTLSKAGMLLTFGVALPGFILASAWHAPAYYPKIFAVAFLGTVLQGYALAREFMIYSRGPTRSAQTHPAPATSRDPVEEVGAFCEKILMRAKTLTRRLYAQATRLSGKFLTWVRDVVGGQLMEWSGMLYESAETHPEKTSCLLSSLLTLVFIGGWLVTDSVGWSIAAAIASIVALVSGIQYRQIRRGDAWDKVWKHWQVLWLVLSLTYFAWALLAGWKATLVVAWETSWIVAAYVVVCGAIGWEKVRRAYSPERNPYLAALLWFSTLTVMIFLVAQWDQVGLIRLHRSFFWGMYLPPVLVGLTGATMLIVGSITVHGAFHGGSKFVEKTSKYF